MVYIDKKELQFIHISYILHKNDVINCLSEILQKDTTPSTVYCLSNIIRIKTLTLMIPGPNEPL